MYYNYKRHITILNENAIKLNWLTSLKQILTVEAMLVTSDNLIPPFTGKYCSAVLYNLIAKPVNVMCSSWYKYYACLWPLHQRRLRQNRSRFHNFITFARFYFRRVVVFSVAVQNQMNT